MHRHANIRHVCETYGAQVLGITPDDVTFSVAKMFFAYGIGNTVFFPFSVGATTVLEPRRPTPDVVRERLEQTRPTLFFGVPTFYAALTASDLPADTFASVRMCASAGEPLPAPLQRRFTDRFGVRDPRRHRLHRGAAHLPVQPARRHPARHHRRRRCPGYDVELRDAAGTVVADGEPGALHVRGESIALGYWHRTDAIAAGVPGRVAGHRRHLRPHRRRLLHLPGPQQRHAQGRRHLGLAGRGGEPAARAPGGARGRGGRRRRRRRPRQAGRRGGRRARRRSRRSWWPGAATGLAHFKAPRQVVFVDRPAQDRDRQAAALQGARPGRRDRARARPGDRRAARWPRRASERR